jgi:hypothetical protein
MEFGVGMLCGYENYGMASERALVYGLGQIPTLARVFAYCNGRKSSRKSL